jgi:hypothetical protein
MSENIVSLTGQGKLINPRTRSTEATVKFEDVRTGAVYESHGRDEMTGGYIMVNAYGVPKVITNGDFVRNFISVKHTEGEG